jgi:putative membrane protein
MMRGFTDHAANERTFLAWVRTGIAVIAFGLVIERFNFFVLAIASSASAEVASRLQLSRLSGLLGQFEFLGLGISGVAMIVAATVRFFLVRRLLDDPESHVTGLASAELILSTALVLPVLGICTYVVLGF